MKRQLCQIYSRVCGWYVNKDSSNPGKQSEYKDRKEYKIKKDGPKTSKQRKA